MKTRIKFLIALMLIVLFVVTVGLAACADNEDPDAGLGGVGGLGGTRKENYDMSKVVFNSLVVAYDGKAHSIEATNLPEGVTVEYENNAQKAVGRYTITAHFSGDEEHYNPIPDQTAILTIADLGKNGIVSANGFELDTNGEFNRLYCDVSNSAEHVDISRKITVAKGCSWKLYQDFEGFVELPLKSMALNIGANTAYAIVFDSNGDFVRYEVSIYRLDVKTYVFKNEGTTYSSGEIQEKSALDKPTDPQKVGYTFKGWAVEGSANVVSFPYTVTGDVTFVAQYELTNYTITYHLDGGTNAESNPSTYNVESDLIRFAPATRKDYTFRGWYADEQFTEQIYSIETGERQGDLQLYAKWAYGTEGLTFQPLGDDGYSLDKYFGTETEVVIPDTWEGLPVITIASRVFGSSSKVTSIAISDSVVTIADDAFLGCGSLISITFGKGSQLATIGENAFMACDSLKSVAIPDSVTQLKAHAFDNCTSLESVTFGDNSQLKAIGNSAFEECTSLQSIIIPDSVTIVEYNVFFHCTALESVTIGAGVISLGHDLFYNCTSLIGVTFKVTTGWEANNTQLDSSALENPSIAKEYLLETYKNYTWTRS